MNVDRRKILLDNLSESTTIDIALKSNFFPVDNAELIDDKFVKDEVDNSINPIVDYKKVIFKPANDNWEIIDRFKINLNFYTQESISIGSPQHRLPGAVPPLPSPPILQGRSRLPLRSQTSCSCTVVVRLPDLKIAA